jgi:hypothetical protein
MLRYFFAGVALAAFLALPATAAADKVVLSRGQHVEIAVVLDRGTGVGAPLTPTIVNAIQMATQLFHSIRGFRVQLDPYDAPCGDEEAVAPNVSVAESVVANPQTVAVIGHECSYAFPGGAGARRQRGLSDAGDTERARDLRGCRDPDRQRQRDEPVPARGRTGSVQPDSR